MTGEEQKPTGRTVLDLTQKESEAVFKIAFYQNEVKSLKIDPSEAHMAVQLSNGEYLLRVYQKGAMKARLDYKEGEGVTFNALGVVRYLESLSIVLGVEY